MTKITALFNVSNSSQWTPAAGHAGRRCLFLCSNTGISVCQLGHNSTLCGVNELWLTNLNGARIFRIIQQSDGAAIFPLEIPDAATHNSAQHLLGESLLCVYRTRTINSTPACSNGPHSPVPWTTSSHAFSRRGDYHCPVKLSCNGARDKSRIQGCPHPDPQQLRLCCESDVEPRIISHHSPLPLEPAGGSQWKLTSKWTNGRWEHLLRGFTFSNDFLARNTSMQLSLEIFKLRFCLWNVFHIGTAKYRALVCFYCIITRRWLQGLHF